MVLVILNYRQFAQNVYIYTLIKYIIKFTVIINRHNNENGRRFNLQTHDS